mmetsp:Transcript_4917/g.17174  ORF Transcript_4917/g.17174 Transcript_4917/m.17174 type:complete len:318 (-) Transcript_4917:202-1155(-)
MNVGTSTLSCASSGGYRLSTATSDISSLAPVALARMSALRATSVPPRSSLGSGSVYPASFASLTTSLKVLPASRPLMTKPSVPLKAPATRLMASPARTSLRTAAFTGVPAPTVLSTRTRLGSAMSASYSAIGPVSGFLFASATPAPPATADARSVPVSAAEQSANMAHGTRPERTSPSTRSSPWSRGRTDAPSAARGEPVALAAERARRAARVNAGEAGSEGRATEELSATAATATSLSRRSARSMNARPTPPHPRRTTCALGRAGAAAIVPPRSRLAKRRVRTRVALRAPPPATMRDPSIPGCVLIRRLELAVGAR